MKLRSAPSKRQFPINWLALFLLAAVPRILGALWLPNMFGDAYVYIRDIGAMSTKLKSGTFALSDLYGFWLPLYQFLSALINVFVNNGFYVGKIVSAIFGAGVCVLVYAITFEIVTKRTAALLAFALIAFNPLHIVNSASAMTDIPHAFFVMASLLFVLRSGWLMAAIFAALAGFTRVESWMLIALIPLIQLLRERCVSFGAIAIMLMPPAFWFYISHKATGDWLACFRIRQQYHDWLLVQNPALAHFSFGGVLKDSATFLVSTDIAVLIATFAAAWLVWKFPQCSPQDNKTNNSRAIVPILIFSFAFLALLVIAYLTHQQPIIFPRYGLILFSLGIPILMWLVLWVKQHRPDLSRKILVSIIVVCMFDASVELAGVAGELNRYKAQRAVADYLRDHYQPKSGTRIFCDEGTVRVLSGIAPEKFLTSADAPRDAEHFFTFLHDSQVEYLIFPIHSNSTPVKLFPDSEYGDEVGPFESVLVSHEELFGTKIWLYHLKS